MCYFWLHWVFVTTGDFSSWGEWGPRGQFWPRRRLSAVASLARSTGFGCVGFGSRGSQALEHRLSRGDARTSLLCSVWDLPGSEVKPVTPASAGGIFPLSHPGKSLKQLFVLPLHAGTIVSKPLRNHLMRFDNVDNTQPETVQLSDGGAGCVPKVSMVLSTVPEPGMLFHRTSLWAQHTFTKMQCENACFLWIQSTGTRSCSFVSLASSPAPYKS